MIVFTILGILIKILDLYQIILLIYCVLSWFLNAYNSKFYQIIIFLVEPLLTPIRRLPLRFSVFDFSPIILFFILKFAIVGLTVLQMRFANFLI